MSLPSMRVHHGATSVPELQAAIEWYQSVLEFEIEKQFDIPGQATSVAMMKRGNMRIELFAAAGSAAAPNYRREPDTDFRTQGNLHLAFVVADVHAFAEELRNRGADIVWVRDFEFGSSAFVRDNSGNLIEFLTE